LVTQIIVFTIGTLFLIYISRKSLLRTKTHGFYRFFVFESCFLLILINATYWFKNPFTFLQIISWIFLIISAYLVFKSTALLKEYGGIEKRKTDPENFKFENTSVLLTNGIYKYIRHPMYSSLLFLCLGTFLKNISVYSVILTIIAVSFLIFTAKAEEKENIKFFGKSYTEYMIETKMFIPLIF